MGVDGCGQLAKCILILFSALFAVIGLGMLALGIGLRLSEHSSGIFDVNLKTQAFVIFVVILMVLGALMVLLSIFGFHGACGESVTSLRVFAVLVAIIAGAEIGFGVLVYTQSREVSENLGEVYASVYAQFVNTRDPSLGATLEVIHNLFDCCGVGGGILEVFVRDTCPSKGMWDTLTKSDCPSKIMNFFQEKAPLVLGFFLSSGAMMIAAFVCYCILSSAITNSRYGMTGII
ncbi:CD9 antigen isoform X2 [Engraulis encrasicolus]|uniref:CD9 antigen isoform X2 n=1 Tax=Engraulis encrasicolus TaxID=184585 RepID=UPI002FD137BC